MSAWLIFNTEFSKKHVEAGGEYKQAFTLASQKWSSMPDAEKQPYVDRGEAAKQLVERQKVELAKKGYYTLEDGSKSTDEKNAHLLKVKKPKSVRRSAPGKLSLDGSDDEEAKFVHPPPKRPGSAWLFFNTEFCKEFVEGGGERAKAFTAASEKWSALPDAEKQPYLDRAEAAKELVAKQRAELAEKGYYTLEDGSRSTDDANSHLLKAKKAKQPRAKKAPGGSAASQAAQSSEEEKQATPAKPAKAKKPPQQAAAAGGGSKPVAKNNKAASQTTDIKAKKAKK